MWDSRHRLSGRAKLEVLDADAEIDGEKSGLRPDGQPGTAVPT